MKVYSIQIYDYESEWVISSDYPLYANRQTAQEVVDGYIAILKADYDRREALATEHNKRKIIEYEALENLGMTPSFNKPTNRIHKEFSSAATVRVGEHEVME